MQTLVWILQSYIPAFPQEPSVTSGRCLLYSSKYKTRLEKCIEIVSISVFRSWRADIIMLYA